jgi:hypothetical protein
LSENQKEKDEMIRFYKKNIRDALQIGDMKKAQKLQKKMMKAIRRDNQSV